MANRREGPGGGEEYGRPLFWVKKEEMTEGRKPDRGKKTKMPPRPP